MSKALLRRAGLILASASTTLLLSSCAGNPAQGPVAEATDSTPQSPALSASRRDDAARPRQDADTGYTAPSDTTTADASPRPFTHSDFTLPAKSYTASTAFTPFREKGVASWYGKMFHGRKTSSGDAFDMYAMTAAHPTLPIPSYVRVTNLSNGRSAVVRINDRGPFHPGRIIDLSYAAAYKLGFADQGQANVEVALALPEGVALVQNRPVPPIRRVARASTPAQATAPVVVTSAAPATPVALAAVEPPAAPAPASTTLAAAAPAGAEKPGNQVFLQLGTFGSLVSAEQFKTFVEHELRWAKESISLLSSDGKHRLHLGPFPSAQEARSMAERIATTLKLKPFVVQR